MSKPIQKYQLQITRVTKYDWSALVVDTTGDKPNATTILSKSIEELMAKCLVAVVLHDKNAGVAEELEPEEAPIILTPNKRIISNGQ